MSQLCMRLGFGSSHITATWARVRVAGLSKKNFSKQTLSLISWLRIPHRLVSKCKSYGPCWSLVIRHAHTLHPRKYSRHPSELTYIYIYIHWPLSAHGHHTSFGTTLRFARSPPHYPGPPRALPRLPRTPNPPLASIAPRARCGGRTRRPGRREECARARGALSWKRVEPVAVRSKKKSSRQAARWRVASEADAIQPATKVGWGWCDVAPQAGVGFFGAGQPTECHHFYKSEYCGRCTVLLTRSVTDAVSLIRTSSQKKHLREADTADVMHMFGLCGFSKSGPPREAGSALSVTHFFSAIGGIRRSGKVIDKRGWPRGLLLWLPRRGLRTTGIYARFGWKSTNTGVVIGIGGRCVRRPQSKAVATGGLPVQPVVSRCLLEPKGAVGDRDEDPCGHPLHGRLLRSAQPALAGLHGNGSQAGLSDRRGPSHHCGEQGRPN